MEKFTLPVETFESFMLAGDSEDFPMSFVLEFELSGSLDHDRLDRAIQRSAAHHPLLFSTIDSKGKHWRFDAELRTTVQKDNYDHALRFDLTKENGVRVIVAQDEPHNRRIGFVFHHACVDGIGAFDFIHDVANAYGEDVEDFQPRSPSIAIAHLRRFRRSYNGNRLVHCLRWPFDLLGMLWSFEMIFKRPRPIEPQLSIEATERVQGENRIGSTANVDRILTPDQSKRVKQLSKSNGQTMNDRVIESFFLAAEEWNAKFHPPNQGSLIRMMVPVNLRKKPSESAANMVAMINLDRRVGRWKSAKWFRKMLRLEMNAVKRMRAGVTANRYLQLQKLFRGRWPMQEAHDRCLTSFLISNLGDLSRIFGDHANDSVKFGDLKATKFRTIVPLRPHANFFVCMFSYLECLNFNTTYNARVLGESHVEDLVDAAQRHLLQE